MTFEKDLAAALQSTSPFQEVRVVIERLLTQGESKEVMYTKLEQARKDLQEQGRLQEEDVVLDVMDLVVGWCSPHMKIGTDS